MARQTIERIVSDLSGDEIENGKGWVMTLTPADGRKNPVRLDITDEEARAFTGKGTEVMRRGRRPGTRLKTSSVRAKSTNGRKKKSATRKKSVNGRRKRTSKP